MPPLGRITVRHAGSDLRRSSTVSSASGTTTCLRVRTEHSAEVLPRAAPPPLPPPQGGTGQSHMAATCIFSSPLGERRGPIASAMGRRGGASTASFRQATTRKRLVPPPPPRPWRGSSLAIVQRPLPPWRGGGLP